ncbi:MAG: aldo/keto reductase [Chloroflexi bacterium]|nr:aldo/keto reductase [Chloroflexota bacterium]
MNFGTPTNEADAIEITHAALDAGINFVDTSDTYNIGVSETIVGKALAGRRSKVILATKVHGKVGDDVNDQGDSRRHIIQGCEDSLRRLNTDYIDLYQIHRPSMEIPIDETLGALTDLVRAGKVRYIGCSNYAAWMLMEALGVSERYGWARYISAQPPYNLLDRRIEQELVPLAERYNVAILPWGPMGQGILTGRYSTNGDIPGDSRAARQIASAFTQRITPLALQAAQDFIERAREFGKSPSQLALLWCKDQPGVTAPIMGPRTLAQLRELLPVLDMSLSPAERQACDAINPPGNALTDFHNSSGWTKGSVS